MHLYTATVGQPTKRLESVILSLVLQLTSGKRLAFSLPFRVSFVTRTFFEGAEKPLMHC